MKKYFKLNLLTLSATIVFALSFIMALIPFTLEVSDSSFIIGFPFAFFAIHVSQNFAFSTHLGIAGLVGNLVLVYAICYFVERCIEKRRKEEPKD